MKKNLLLLLTLLLCSILTYGQQKKDSLNLVIKNLKEGLNTLEAIINNKNDSLPVAIPSIVEEQKEIVVANNFQNQENQSDIKNLDYGDYKLHPDHWFLEGVYNPNIKISTSPLIFEHMGNNDIYYLSTGYTWATKSHQFYNKNWWLTKSYQSEINISTRLYSTNEYEVSASGNYNLSYAHNYLSAGIFFNGGVYSSLRDSIMKPYFIGGLNVSVFCIYGAISWTYSPYLPYKSMYTFMDNFVPVYELGLKTPDINIGKLYFGIKTIYSKYCIFQQKEYKYDEYNQVVEDLSRKKETAFYKGSLSVADFDGNNIQVGVLTHNLEKFYISISFKANLNKIGKYFRKN